ncbi:MAG: class IV adenylate cyclase [Proteobacteria bacterium]|nr:class IV adenylate cyclase [Pseudomonadota bacterium]MBU1594701.1 class IV adenylate cyclase [Pseudomonadota bacterium]
MPLEIEVKYLDADHAALRPRLAAQDATCLGRWFESNIVFDDARRSLKACGTLLRLREKRGLFVLTLKRTAPGAAEPGLKVYEESETEVSAPAALVEILAGLGLAPVLRYEKFREKWLLLDCAVCLDTLPFGDFVEIEGSRQGIGACALALGLPDAQASTATYHQLNREQLQAKGLAPDESFVFAEAAKAMLLALGETARNGDVPLDSRPGSA